MYCKKCGHEIENDSNFCKNCGEGIKDVVNETSDKKDHTSLRLFLLLIFVLVAIILVAAATRFDINNNLEEAFSEKATIKDIELDFYEIPSLGGNTKYGVVIQANEKIENLIIEIDFLDKDKHVLKTETIRIGKITPGNEYKYELNQTGMEISQLDKTKSFNTRVIGGYITE